MNKFNNIMNYIKGYYIYPNGNIKVQFNNNRQRIFLDEQDLINYVEENKEKLL